MKKCISNCQIKYWIYFEHTCFKICIKIIKPTKTDRHHWCSKEETNKTQTSGFKHKESSGVEFRRGLDESAAFLFVCSRLISPGDWSQNSHSVSFCWSLCVCLVGVYKKSVWMCNNDEVERSYSYFQQNSPTTHHPHN